jgi:hypothetical protein
VTRAWMILTFAVVVGTVPAYGHHSFAAYYLEDQTVSIEGELMELDYLNPHSWVHIAAADTTDRVHRVSAEWSNPGRLQQQGITKDTLKPGDRVIVTGSPARDPSEYKMHLKRIERPADGWKWIGQGQRF